MIRPHQTQARDSRRSGSRSIDRGRGWDYPRSQPLAGFVSTSSISYAQLVHERPRSHARDAMISTRFEVSSNRSANAECSVPGDDRRILNGSARGHVSAIPRPRERSSSPGPFSARRASCANGLHPSFTPVHEASADREAACLLGFRRAHADILHVGSAIAGNG